MLLTGEPTEKAPFYSNIFREILTYRERLLEPSRTASPWTVSPQVRGGVFPAVAAVSYLALWFLLQSLGPDFYSVSEQWSWDLAGGLSFGFLIGFGLGYAPLVFLAHLLPLLGDPSSGVGVIQAVAFAMSNTTVYGLACYISRRAVTSQDVDLEDRSMLGVVLALIPFTALATALISTLNWWIAGVLNSGLGNALLIKAFANGMGLISVGLFVPLNGMPLLNRLVARSTVPAMREKAILSVRDWMTGSGLFLTSGAASAIALGMRYRDRFDIYLMILAPLVAMALRFGLRGLTVSFLAIAGARSVIPILGYPPQDGFAMEATVLTALLSGLIIASLATESLRSQSTAKTQSVLMDAVAQATGQVLRTTDQDKDVTEVLRELVGKFDATCLYVLENQHDQHSGQPIHYEHWGTGGAHDGKLQKRLVLVRNSLVHQNRELLARGHALQYRTAELPERDRKTLQALNIESSIVLPIFADGHWWGCLGVDRSITTAHASWSEYEISALMATGGVLGSLLAHANIEQQFRQLTGTIPAVFWIGQPDGLKKTYVSPAFDEIWGLSSESVGNNPQAWIGAIHREDYGRIHSALSKQKAGDYDVEYRVVPASGPTRWVRDMAFPVRNATGEVNRIVGIAQDITPQKEAEDRVRAASFLLRSLIDNLRPGILVEDDDRKVRHANHAFCRMFGVRPPGESLPAMESFIASSPAGLLTADMDALILGEATRQGDEIASEDGRIFSRDYTPLAFESGEVYHLWSFEDITDRKHTEQQIRSSLAEKEILLKEIHHRVKNNLQVISSLLNLQSMRTGEKRTVEAFRDSQSRVKAMALVHERLYRSSDLARIDFGGYVEEITRHLLRSYHSHASGTRLETDIEPVELSIDTAIPCGLIINELVSNSLKYAFPNDRGGHIHVRLSEGDEALCRLSISDDGIGFPPEIFEKDGHSLGLQLVRNLVAQLGGNVQYSNNGGAEFIIEFRPVTGENTSGRNWVKSEA